MFFFFKQKTAYELRISDWSSDVCSSDLTGIEVTPHAVGEGNLGLTIVSAIGWALLAALFFARVGTRLTHTFTWHGALAGAMAGHDIGIGRASCRERVCKYV